MFTLSVTSNVKQALQRLSATRVNIPLATAKALTFTARDVQAAEKTEMSRVFDRPTPFTFNSLYMRGATPSTLEARVYFKDLRASSKNQGRPEQHYLEPQVYGGTRSAKLFEIYLRKAGVLPASMYAMPGRGAKLDAYGNMARGQITQILSALNAAEHSSGYFANRSKRLGARANKVTARIFAGRPHPGMPLGVWMRDGAKLRSLLVFTRAPHYKVRLKFYDLANAIGARELPAHLDRAMRSASNTVYSPAA